MYLPGEDQPCVVFTLNKTAPEWVTAKTNCDRAMASDARYDPTTIGAEHRCLITVFRGAERAPSGDERILAFYRDFLVPAIDRVEFASARVPFRRIQTNPKEKGFTVLGGIVAPANVFSCAAIQEVPVGAGGGESLQWKTCKKKEFKLPSQWERIRYKRDGTLKAWFSNLRKDKMVPMADLYSLDSKAAQNVRLYKLQLPDVTWTRDGTDHDFCPIVLLERDCRLVCLSLCEVAFRHDVPVLTIARDSYLLASNVSGRGAGIESAVREFPGTAPKKQEKRKCPNGDDPDLFLFASAPCRKGAQVKVTWNAFASWVGLSSEELWRANAGEAREISWLQCMAECSLASYFLMAFLFPLLTEAALGLPRGSRPGLCFIVTLAGMAVVRASISMAALPFSASWYLLFLPMLLAVVRENCRISPSLSEIMATVSALGCAGMSRSADNGWIILVAQSGASLFLALGAAVSTSLSMSAVVSLALYVQHAGYDGTLLHRLSAAPMDVHVLYLAWSSYADPDLDELADIQGEGLVTFYAVSTVLSLVARYSLLMSFLTFSLPSSPWVLDRSGRVKKAVFTALFSSLKAESAQHPARVSILIVVFGVANPALMLGLFLLLINAQDDSVLQINQATYQALIDKLTCVEATVTQRAAGERHLVTCLSTLHGHSS
jgi:hypothetical protein